ncbi:hypothetical protein L207DRAFT_537485 [Hyaloscypha variabilis F]|uniref:Transposase Tc1-like domain-containing protein n=1 Tax=Hyaloscypha variabilis (strain UAMH 11265 / GT02V1 / F) TaxID=1149755 RepID=A0A2J6QXS9_HYAVF|nr:hypothetical protein L207DRAFT_537485 [Hyaloscypha variabilis F]
MPPQRTPLGSISGNSRWGKELTPYIRGQIAVRRIARRRLLLTTKAPGKSYTPAQERRCVRHARLNLKDIYQQVIDACGLLYRRSTVKKILKKHSICNWRAKKRPELIEAHALNRLTWCLAYRGWTSEE